MRFGQQKVVGTLSSWLKSSWGSTSGGLFGGVFSALVLEETPGFVLLRVTGDKASLAFKHEAGGHRFQRVPPTEKRGRVHTSTVTVATLELPQESQVKLNERDLEWKATRGSGAGGQHRNKTDSAIQLKHLPSGIQVRVETERSQHQNLMTAKAVLAARLLEADVVASQGARNKLRKAQVGTGMRGDKIRTIAVQRDQVVDHKLGTRTSVTKYLKGDLTELVG